MNRTTTRRTLSLESLEHRISPAILGLSLPSVVAPLAALTSQEGIRLPLLSLTSAPQGQSGLGLSVNLGVLSLGVGTTSPQTSSPLGVEVAPPAQPQAPAAAPLAVVPSLNAPAVAPTPAPLLSPVLQAVPPAASTPGTPTAPAPAVVSPALAAPLPAPQAATPAEADNAIGIASFAGIGVTNIQEPAGNGAESSSATFQVPRVNDSNFAALSAVPPRLAQTDTPRAESDADDVEEELFGLRDGNLLEDFGAAIGADDAVLLSAPSDDAPEAGTGNGTALWLVGALAAGLAGSAWLTDRREREDGVVETNPSLIPLE